MTAPLYELDEWEDEVAAVIRQDRHVPGAGHRDEDRLLERYVRDRAYGGDPVAVALIKMLDSPRRRWYA